VADAVLDTAAVLLVFELELEEDTLTVEDDEDEVALVDEDVTWTEVELALVEDDDAAEVAPAGAVVGTVVG